MMKKITFFILVILFTVKAIAQAAPGNYTAAVNKFKLFYNQEQPDSIFSMFSPEMKAELPLDKFKPTTVQLRSQLGTLLNADFISINGQLAVYKATFQHSVFLLNLALSPKNQLNGLSLSPFIEKAPKGAPIDPALTETPVRRKTLFGTIAGSLVMPKDPQGKIPVVLIIGDAGATDRDGNNEKTGTNANTYKLLANDLGKNGIASVRYDKRNVGESVSSTKPNQMHIEDLSDDAFELINMLNDDPRFSKIILFGHGEGALVAMIAQRDGPIKGLITAEGAGEQADKILTTMMKSKPQLLADEFKAIMDSLRKGKTTDRVDPALYSIAGPSVQPFLMSWCRYVPPKVLKTIKVPVLIVQGSTDLQVPADNADKLKKGKSDAQLLVIKEMNHLLKQAPADPEQNQATFSKPDLPLKPELIAGVVDFITKLK